MNSSSFYSNTSVTKTFFEDEIFSTIAVIVSVFGAATFLTNILVLAVIVALLKKTDKYGIITHTFFVCANDTLCGLILLIIGVVRIYDYVSAYACAVLVLTIMSLQVVSQGNIACVCIQRHFITKHIRRTQASWKPSYTKILVVVNGLIGSVSLTTSLSQLRVDHHPPVDVTCRLLSVVTADPVFMLTINFVLGIALTGVADVFCLLTIRRLKSEVDTVVQQAAGTSNSNTIDSRQNDSTRIHAKARLQTAATTLFLIVVFFNLSILPSLLSYTLVYAGIVVSDAPRRLLLLSMYMNSLANPIIIATRVQDIRNYFTSVLSRIQANIWHL